ncbi:MAG: RES family NAD+ phosphorylase [Lapillicoccus sp.]
MTDREQVAQREPAVPLAGFPAYPLRPDETLHRAHHRDRGPWWFSSTGGRFDLAAPLGTCYLADSPLAALRERLGVVLGAAPTVPGSMLEDAVVSRLHLRRDHRLADVQDSGASGYGVTRELETMVPYAVPQVWARAFHDAGFEGVRYGPRFSTGSASSTAVFGAVGSQPGPVDPSPLPGAEVPDAPVAIEAPRRWDVTVVKPPRTRPR